MKPDLDTFTREDILELEDTFPGVVEWLKRRTARRIIETLRAQAELGEHQIGEHNAEYLRELEEKYG